MVSLVLTQPASNPRPLHLRLKGLDPQARYVLENADFFGCEPALPHAKDRTFTGAALMFGGYTLPIMPGDYPSVQMFWKKVSN